MLNVRLKKEGGFTLIELLIVVVIIGILAAVAVPMYTRYITSAKAAEATTNLNALAQYVQGFARAHPSDWTSSGLLATNTDDTPTGTDTKWMEEIVGTPVYFTYDWDVTTTPASPRLRANGKAGTDFTAGTDYMTATLGSGAETVTYAGAGKLAEIAP